MNIRSCEYIIAIAEKGSLSEAAKSLGVSQPTLSNFLGNTERRLGKALFIRHKKSMISTKAGQMYLDACRKIVEVKKQTYHSIMTLCHDYTEQFTIGVSPHRGSTVFSHAFAKFYRSYPNVSVNLKEGYMNELLNALDTKEVDATLGTAADGDMEKYGFISEEREELLLCVPDFHPLAALANRSQQQRSHINITCFQDTPFVMWGEMTTNRRIVKKLLDDAKMTPTVVYQSNNVLLIDNMLQNGVGVGFLPSVFCKPNQGRVYFSMEPPIYSTLGIFYRKDAEFTKAQRYFFYLLIKDCLNDYYADSFINQQGQNILEEFEEGQNGHKAD